MDIPYKMLGIGEIGFVIGKNFRKNGYAREAVDCILKYLFDEKQMYMIEAKVNEYNTSSENLLVRLGFKKDGVLRSRRINLINGKRCDMMVYSITNEEYHSRLKAAPYWSKITIHFLKTGEISHGTVLVKAREYCMEETGNESFDDIPEKYWEKAYHELIE